MLPVMTTSIVFYLTVNFLSLIKTHTKCYNVLLKPYFLFPLLVRVERCNQVPSVFLLINQNPRHGFDFLNLSYCVISVSVQAAEFYTARTSQNRVSSKKTGNTLHALTVPVKSNVHSTTQYFLCVLLLWGEWKPAT